MLSMTSYHTKSKFIISYWYKDLLVIVANNMKFFSVLNDWLIMSVKKNVAVLCSNYYPIMGGPATCIDKYVSSLSESYNFYIITRNDSIK